MVSLERLISFILIIFIMTKQLVRVQVPGNYDETEDFVGLEAALINIEKSLKGAQTGMVNYTREDSYGAQLGGFNINEGKFLGFKLGILNAGDYFRGFCLGLINIYEESPGFRLGLGNGSLASLSNKRLSGLDIAITNYAGRESGLQLGVLNVVKDEFKGVQIGAVCIADKGNYLQLGLITYRANRNKWYQKFSPLIGFGNKE